MADKRTRNALLARGLDSVIADNILGQDYTVASLQALTIDQLLALGLNERQAREFASVRPPIPEDTLIAVLSKSHWTCCVCKDRSKGIIVHHLEPWTDSKSHAENNLVVLCLDHHGEAHTKRELSLSMDAARLRAIRDKWYADAREARVNAIVRPESYLVLEPTWDYFNHRRIVEVARRSGVQPEKMPQFLECMDQGLLTKSGFPRRPDGQIGWWFLYDGYMRDDMFPVYTLYAKIVQETFRNSEWVNLNEHWSRSEIRSLLKDGMLMWVKGAFYFKNIGTANSGPQQMRRALRRKRGIHLSFTFDAFETTSSSAQTTHLSGRSVVSCFCEVHSLLRSKDVYEIKARCLAIGSGFGPIGESWVNVDEEDDDTVNMPDESVDEIPWLSE